MQAYFFPYIGYFQLIDYVDTFMIYEHVSFRKKSWITRNRIYDKGKKEPIVINVPVLKQSSEKSIGETLIDNRVDWRKKILNLIFFNYKKAPFFEEVFPELERIILMDGMSIHDYNSSIITGISTLLDIKTTIISDNSDYLIMEGKLKDLADDNDCEVKSQRIFEICRKEGALNYVNPIGGTELYDKNLFLKNGIELSFVETKRYTYEQFNGEFEPHLSIIDVLMHNGIEETKKMVKNYKIV